MSPQQHSSASDATHCCQQESVAITPASSCLPRRTRHLRRQRANLAAERPLSTNVDYPGHAPKRMPVWSAIPGPSGGSTANEHGGH
jgi:hypothetical protein